MLVLKSVFITILTTFYFYFIKDYIKNIGDYIREWHPALTATGGTFCMLMLLLFAFFIPFIIIQIISKNSTIQRVFIFSTMGSGLAFFALIVFTTQPSEYSWYVPMFAASVLCRSFMKPEMQ